MSSNFLSFPDHSKVFPGAEPRKIVPRDVIPSGDRPCILMAVEDPVRSLTLFHFLSQAGYQVVVTETGQDAIRHLRKADHPAVAILDAALSGMSGSEICTRMSDAGKNVYLILMSEHTGTKEMIAALQSGADACLTNSAAPELLLAYVKVGLRTTARLGVSAAGGVNG